MSFDLTSLPLAEQYDSKTLSENLDYAKRKVDELQDDEEFQKLSGIDQVGIMSNILFGATEYPNGPHFRWNTLAWNCVLRLARMYGWEPRGTRAPDEENPETWSGTYKTNQIQTVEKADALGLGNALEKALPDIPDDLEDVPIVRRTVHVVKEGEELDSQKVLGAFSNADKESESMDVLAALGGPYKPKLENFIAFCRMGEFKIA